MQTKEDPIGRDEPGAILLCDRIIKLVENDELIVIDPHYKDIGHTFNKDQLKRAKYDVRLGKAYYQHGDYHLLSDDNPLLTIAPYELVFVESYEVFKMPRNVVAVYDLRVSGCLGGLGLQTGLQLDPTYYGRFFCPLFNFSDKEVVLTYKDHLASVQFVYTTPSTQQAEETKAFDKNELFCLRDSLPSVSRSSGLESLHKETITMKNTLDDTLKDFKETLKADHERLVEARRETQNINMVFLAVIGLAVTVIGAVQVPQAITRAGTTPWWAVLIIVIAFVIVVYMLFRFVSSLFRRNH